MTQSEFGFIFLPHTSANTIVFLYHKYSFWSIYSVYNAIIKDVESFTKGKTLKFCDLHNNSEAAGSIEKKNCLLEIQLLKHLQNGLRLSIKVAQQDINDPIGDVALYVSCLFQCQYTCCDIAP